MMCRNKKSYICLMEEQISERNLAISCKVKVTLHPSNSKHTCVRKHSLPTKVHIVKAMVFPVVMYGCESCTRKKAECLRIDTFKLWCWRRLENPSNCKEMKPVNPKGNQHWILTGRTWCWSWTSNTLATWCKEQTHWKRPWCWKRLKAKAEGSDGGWDGWIDHGLNGHEFEQILGDGEGQESLVCTWYMCTWCTWGHKVGQNLAVEQQQFSKRLHLSYNRLSRRRDRLTSKLKLWMKTLVDTIFKHFEHIQNNL